MINSDPNSVEPDDATASIDPSDVGARIRRLREVYGMSQRELARLAGVTNGAISVIEQNRVSPSVASLKKILEAFQLTLSDFFADEFDQDTQVFYRADDMTRIADGLVVLRQIGADMSRRRLQVLHETYASGGDTGPAMLSHAGEEAGVVVRGNVEVQVGGQCKVLGPGDGYYFNSRIPHRFRNLGTDECEIVSSCTPPTF
jgi:transcriptional regulator with XRE-family HTH domain